MRIVVAEDDESDQKLISDWLSGPDCDVRTFSLGERAWDYLRSSPAPDCLLLDVRLPDSSGMEIFRRVRQTHPAVPIVIITGFGNTEQAVQAMKEGAHYYFTKPFDFLLLKKIVDELLQKVRLQRQSEAMRRDNYGLIGESPAIRKVIERIRLVASLAVTVLITGETGTGKELVAQATHCTGSRRSGPFLAVNCAAVPLDLLESELFGFEKGAFSGAAHCKPGKLEAADRGSLLLDEIGDLPLALQAKLLRVIETKAVERLGSLKSRTVDVRFLAASNNDLEQLVRSGSFRQDLYFRLNAFEISIPPLRKRLDDLPLLVAHFLEQLNACCGRQVESVDPPVLEAFRSYDWPGNVRELRHVLESAIICCPGNRLRIHDLPPRPAWRATEVCSVPSRLDDLERAALRSALEKTCGNQSAAARLLGITRNTMRYRLRKHGLDRQAGQVEGDVSPS